MATYAEKKGIYRWNYEEGRAMELRRYSSGEKLGKDSISKMNKVSRRLGSKIVSNTKEVTTTEQMTTTISVPNRTMF